MTVLTRDDVLNFESVIRTTFAVQVAIRAVNPLAKQIKFPSIPTSFSENIVRLAASKLFPQYNGYTASLGGRLADVILSSAPGKVVASGTSSPHVVKVEVKATGSRETLELKTRDVQADILVWLAFGNRFECGKGSIDVYVLPSPKSNPDVQKVAGRVVKLQAFTKAAKKSPNFQRYTYRLLRALI